MTRLIATLLAALVSLPALAGEIVVSDAYARSSNAQAAAAFLVIENASDVDDRLLDARSDAARKVELHTHLEDEGGVMRMRPIEGGIEIPAGARHSLARGGDHVMLMGLVHPLAEGDSVPLVLVFEHAGEIALDVPVDQDRQPGHAPAATHGQGNGQGHGHGQDMKMDDAPAD